MSTAPELSPSAPDPIRSSELARSIRKPEVARATRPAFEVLLDRLTTRAAELEEKHKALATPEQVGEAVDAARASLEDALTLGERLLEAYRQAQRTGSKEGAP